MTLIATFFALLVKVCRDLGTSLTGGNPLHLDVKLTKFKKNREFEMFYSSKNLCIEAFLCQKVENE